MIGKLLHLLVMRYKLHQLRREEARHRKEIDELRASNELLHQQIDRNRQELEVKRAELHESMTRSAEDIGRIREAVYATSNPPELCEMWYMTGDKNLGNISLKLVHQILPSDELDKQEMLQKLEESYGEIKIVGYTYASAPYQLGYCRLSDNTRQIIEDNVRSQTSLDSIENIARQQVDPEERNNMLARIDQLRSSKELTERYEAEVQRIIKENTRCLTTGEAEKKAGEFYLFTPQAEDLILAESVQAQQEKWARIIENLP